MNELEQRVSAEVEAHRREYGHDVSTPLHGEAGGVKWRVHGDDPDRADWKGGYVCYCGDVFAREVSDGGMPAALAALGEHLEEQR